MLPFILIINTVVATTKAFVQNTEASAIVTYAVIAIAEMFMPSADA